MHATDTTLTFKVRTAVGDFDVSPADIIRFPEGLPGFEQSRQFVLLSAPALAPLQCLQSVDGPPLSFLVVDPRVAMPGYDVEAGRSDLERLGATDGTALLWLVLVGLDETGAASLNLRAPIVINPARMEAHQLIYQSSRYPFRYRLAAA